MVEKKYLNEEKYQKTEKTLTIVAVLVLVIGLFIGGFLIYRGIATPEASKIDSLKTELESKRIELESKGIRYNTFAKYTDGEAYDLKIITNALDPSFSYCHQDEYINNSLTKEYCASKNSTGETARAVFMIPGAFLCFLAFMISLTIFATAKRRHILAFHAQQVMPVVKEGVDEMTPVAANAAKKMAPAAGSVAKEIAKGIKEGLKDDKKDN